MTGRFEKKVGCVMLIFFVLRALLALAIGGGAAWVVIHFLVKYW